MFFFGPVNLNACGNDGPGRDAEQSRGEHDTDKAPHGMTGEDGIIGSLEQGCHVGRVAANTVCGTMIRTPMTAHVGNNPSPRPSIGENIAHTAPDLAGTGQTVHQQ